MSSGNPLISGQKGKGQGHEIAGVGRDRLVSADIFVSGYRISYIYL